MDRLELDLSENDLTELPDLSKYPSLRFLTFRHNSVTSFKGCENNEHLIAIDCDFNQITSFEFLPKNLKYLSCDHNLINSWKHLPTHLYRLSISDNQLISVDLSRHQQLKHLDLSLNPIRSLEGCPEIMEDLNCSRCSLKNLQGAPKIVGHFDCSMNQLENLKSGPESVDSYDCSSCQLETLEGITTDLKKLICRGNELETLEGIPDVEVLDIRGNKLTDLRGCPRVKILDCSGNYIDTLEGASIEIRTLYCSDNLLASTLHCPKYLEQLVCFGNAPIKFEGIPNTIRKMSYKRFVNGCYESDNEIVTSIRKTNMLQGFKRIRELYFIGKYGRKWANYWLLPDQNGNCGYIRWMSKIDIDNLRN